ncbi:hypothetical protein K5X82_17775 [Halosquirtibacter xylanolyticus]|uniref:hypothetical protein n=1 Tax=Halosquirtibacter xylanolyticus TaxID=3374599 RepID=UPI00374855EF|nr:hypothetical protein K5X82_17775 [Prolixibacteraceae bacterium]
MESLSGKVEEWCYGLCFPHVPMNWHKLSIICCGMDDIVMWWFVPIHWHALRLGLMYGYRVGTQCLRLLRLRVVVCEWNTYDTDVTGYFGFFDTMNFNASIFPEREAELSPMV